MTPLARELRPARAAVGSARETRARLSSQRSRPALVSAYVVFLGESGYFGAPARRRLVRFALRSAPAAAVLAASALVALRAFAERPLGLTQGIAAAVVGSALFVVGRRRVEALRAGRRPGSREELELGALLLVVAFAVAQASQGLAGSEPALQPLVYLTLAAVAALHRRSVGAALVGFAVALEAVQWWSRGAETDELPSMAAHVGFAVAFAALYHRVLGGRVAASRKAEDAAVDRRRRELDERARQLRLLPVAGAPMEGDRTERAARLTEAAVLESEAAARGLLAIVEGALRAHTSAVYLLSDDDAELQLWDCRSASERVARSLPAGEGPLGGVVKRRAPVRLHGAVKSANHYADGTRPGALLAVPVLARLGGHLRGVLLADRLEPRPFDEADERLLAGFAAELARATDAERLIRDGRASREEQERFYQAIERLNRTSTPREVFDALLEVAAEIVSVDFGAVTLLEESRGEARHRIARATTSTPARGETGQGTTLAQGSLAELEGREFPDNGGLVACAARLGSSLPAKPLRMAEAVVFDEETRMKGLASLKVVPLRSGEAVLGTMVLGARSPGAYSNDDVRQLEVIAMQAGDSILRARLFEATERLATTDGLTGLVNHRTFQARLDDHLAAAERYGKKLSLLLTDVDHFKSVNDTYGHPVGDVVLKGIARILMKEARATDVAARYGGEEFALVMPETDMEGARRTAERIREKVSQAVFQTDQGELKVTLSIGVASFPEDARKKADLIELADGGLYHAKRHGRNQTVALGQLKRSAARR